MPSKLLDWLEDRCTPIVDWINVPIYKRVRRIDIVIVLLGIVCVIWGAVTTGWQGALYAGLMYVLMVMLALWFF